MTPILWALIGAAGMFLLCGGAWAVVYLPAIVRKSKAQRRLRRAIRAGASRRTVAASAPTNADTPRARPSAVETVHEAEPEATQILSQRPTGDGYDVRILMCGEAHTLHFPAQPTQETIDEAVLQFEQRRLDEIAQAAGVTQEDGDVLLFDG